VSAKLFLQHLAGVFVWLYSELHTYGIHSKLIFSLAGVKDQGTLKT
jgi:hypothetical protein